MIGEVGFYHLTAWPLDRALPQLMEKVVERGLRAVLVVREPDRLKHVDRLLWTYKADSFLPHGSKALGFADKQALWLTDRLENPNASQVLVVVDGLLPPKDAPFDRLLDLFDGADEAELSAARSRWKAWRETGTEMTYWQQQDGRWNRAHSVAAKAVPSEGPSAPL